MKIGDSFYKTFVILRLIYMVKFHTNKSLIQTQPGLYLLMTFHNLSAPYTVDCHGAYIEVERENNGYDARWCGNRITPVSTSIYLFHFILCSIFCGI